MKMGVSATTWTSIGTAVLGGAAGFGLATYQQPPLRDLEEDIRTGANVEYESTYTNAVVFRSRLRKEHNLDSLFAREPFLAKCIRILWQDSGGLEALSIPPPGRPDHLYLIRGDSITQLQVSPRKSR